MPDPSVLGIVLAGGAGTRLSPLTADRAKPAVPFGGLYRLIDFALSNLVNGGIRKICVLTQYKSHSLDRHISTTWRMSDLLGNYVTPVPAQQRLGPQWYTGSADAIYQSMNLINDEKPDHVIVFGADHVYRMDPSQMIEQHIEHGAGVTVASIPVPREEATDFGVVGVGKDGRTVEAFLEKPADPPGIPGSPHLAYASMGNYVFDTNVLVDALRKDAADDSSRHDMGGNIVPMLVRTGIRAGVRLPEQRDPRRRTRRRPVLARRRHAGLLLRRAHGPVRDPAAVQPVQRPLADPHLRALAAPGEVRARERRPGRPCGQQRGQQRRDRLRRPGARIRAVPRRADQRWASVERSVILHNTVDRPARRGTERDHRQERGGTRGREVGVDKEHDRARGFVVSDGGVTVVGKSQEVTQ